MGRRKMVMLVLLFVALGAPFVVAQPVFAASGEVVKVENFIRSVIKLLAGIAGLVATGFFCGRWVYVHHQLWQPGEVKYRQAHINPCHYRVSDCDWCFCDQQYCDRTCN